jgi:hypothetical protein
MMAASELRSKRTKTAPPRRSFQPKTPSWLQRLPIELLECIFLHSLEINMIHALPFLGKTLSKESIYRVLILFAFFDDDGQHPVEQKHFDPASYRMLSDEERSHLQMAVFESRWCTIARTKQYLPTLMRLVAVQLWHAEHEKGKRGLEAPPAQDGAGLQQQAGSPLPPLSDPPAVHADSNAARIVSWPFQSDSNFRIQHNGIDHKTLHMYKFPPRLLNPASWLPNTIYHNANPFDFLTLLWDCSSPSNPHQTAPLVDEPTLLLSLATAIRDNHHSALKLLLQIQEQCSSTRPHGSDGGEGSRPEIPVTLIHLATRQGRESEFILKLLLRGGLAWKRLRILKDDDVLTKWAIRHEEMGSQFARSLLGLMERDGVDRPCAAGGKGR